MLKVILAVVVSCLIGVLAVGGLFWANARSADAILLPSRGNGVVSAVDSLAILPDSVVAMESENEVPTSAPDSALSSPTPDSSSASKEPQIAQPSASGGDPAPASSVPSRLSDAEIAATSQEIKEAQERFGRMFASMKPEDAVRILEHLSDDAARGVLSQVSSRTAAAILSRLPSQRAASIAAPLLPTLSVPARKP